MSLEKQPQTWQHIASQKLKRCYIETSWKVQSLSVILTLSWHTHNGIKRIWSQLEYGNIVKGELTTNRCWVVSPCNTWLPTRALSQNVTNAPTGSCDTGFINDKEKLHSNAIKEFEFLCIALILNVMHVHMKFQIYTFYWFGVMLWTKHWQTDRLINYYVPQFKAIQMITSTFGKPKKKMTLYNCWLCNLTLVIKLIDVWLIDTYSRSIK